MGDRSIKIFDKNGKYLKVFDRKGRGPQEYEYLGGLSIDYETGNLLVETSRKIVEYTSEGNFVRNIDMYSDSLPEYNFGPSVKLGPNCYLLSVSFARKMDYSAVVIDTSSAVKHLINYPESQWAIITARNGGFSGATHVTLFKYKDKTRIINGTDEYIIGIDKDLNTDTSYIINYGPYKITAENAQTVNNESPLINRYAFVYESDNNIFLQFNLRSLAHKPQQKKVFTGDKYIRASLKTYC